MIELQGLPAYLAAVEAITVKTRAQTLRLTIHYRSPHIKYVDVALAPTADLWCLPPLLTRVVSCHLLGPQLGMHVPWRLRQDVASLE